MKKGIKLNFNEQKQRFSLTLLFALVVFCILVAAIGLAAVTVYILVLLKVFGGTAEEIKIVHIILFMSLFSLVIGSGVSMLLGKVPLRPINKLVNGMNSLASGNFKTRIQYGGPIGNHPTFNEITVSFNMLAEELENTEVLRNDFINNFSHEFKTPIVSIAGFAKLLKKGNLTEEQRQQYLDAIEKESMRLSYMATNVLNMSKVENQTILTDVTSYNLSEQIRFAVLLLEGKWSKKNIDFQLEFDEHDIEANEELLKQIWINLVDNAIKFSPENETVRIDITNLGDRLSVKIGNHGKTIPEDKLKKIFNKFYQCDESHASEGNGIGLAIVGSVVALHGGTVTVESKDEYTEFCVILPKKQ